MICPNCNNQVEPGLAFCPHCGTSMNRPVQQPGNNPQYAPQQGRGGNSNMLAIVCVILGVLLVGVIACVLFMYYNNSEKEKEVLAQQVEIAQKAQKEAEEKKPDTVVVEKTKTVAVPQPTYTEPVNPSLVVIKGNSVNIREQPSLSAYSIGLVYKGTSLTFCADLGDWYEVYYGGRYGYVRKYHTNGKRIAVAR